MSQGKARPNDTLRRIREVERNQSEEEFARLMAEMADRMGIELSPSAWTVIRLETGQTAWPQGKTRRVLAALLQRSIEDCGFVPRPSKARIVQAQTAILEGDNDISVDAEERSSNGLDQPGAGRGPDLDALRRELSAILNETTVSSSSLDEWERTAINHGVTSRYRSVTTMLFALSVDLADLKQTLASCHSAAALRRLTRVAAQMAGLVCLAFVRLDDRMGFRNWARTARLAADEARDPVTYAWVLAQEAYGHYYSGDLRMAIETARAAQSASRSACAGAALAAALEARAHASMENAAEAREAIARAEAVLSSLQDAETGATAFGYNEAQLRFHEGSAYTQLGDARAAWRAQERALALYPESDYTDRTLIYLDHSICLARDGEAPSAVEIATSALSALNQDERKGIIIVRARDLLASLPEAAKTLPPVSALRELLQSSLGRKAEWV